MTMSGGAGDSTSDRSIRLDHLSKQYASRPVVDVSQLTIAEGEFLTLLGPSGCGKTTLLLMIAGFVQPTTGTIHVGSQDITSKPPEKRNFGMVFQGYALFPHLSVAGNVAYPLRRRGMGKQEIVERVERTLAKVRLSEFADRMPKQLSGGQQQRVALARSIVFEPDLVLLDEPLSALDTSLRHDLRLQLKSLHRETGTTFVCVTHDQDEALSMSDRIAVMRDGRIVQLATPRELYTRPKNRFVAGFMGAKNSILAQVRNIQGTIATCECNGITFQQILDPACGAVGSTALLAMRPSSLSVGPSPGGNNVSGTIEALNYFGSAVVVTLNSPIGILTIEHPGESLDARFAIGREIVVGWRPDAAVIVEDA